MAKMWINPSYYPTLDGWLKERGHDEARKGFEVDGEQFKGFVEQSYKLHSKYSQEKHDAWAAYTCYTLGKPPKPEARAEFKPSAEQLPVVHQFKLLREMVEGAQKDVLDLLRPINRSLESILNRLPEKKDWLQPPPEGTPVQVVQQVTKMGIKERIALWGWRALLLAALLFLLFGQAHSQGVPHSPLVIDLEDATVSQAIRAGGLIRLNCGANLTCVWDTANNRFTMDAGVGGSVAWDGITAPGGNQALAMAAWTSTWTWNATTGANDLFTGTDTASNTGTGYLFNWITATGSALKPFRICYRGTTDCITLDTTTFQAVGSATIVADSGWPVDSVFTRTGAVVAAEGDYSLTLLSDVTGTSGSGSTSPLATFTSLTAEDFLRWSGSNWVNTALLLAGPQFANQGTTTTLAHGNPAGNPSWGSVVPADMDLTANYTWTGQHDYTGAEILGASPFRFEGATDDGTYTTLAFTDPTSANTLTIPDDSGTTLLYAGDDNVFGATENVTIDGSTNPRAVTLGILRIEQTAGVPGTHAIRIITNAAGFGDTKSIEIEWIGTGVAAGDIDAALGITLDTANSTGGNVFALEVSKVGAGTATTYSLLSGIGINPILNEAGSFGNVEIAFTFNGGFTDVTANFNSTATDSTLFVSNGDLVYIGMAAQFDEVEFILDTVASGAGVKPTFAFSDGASGWTAFSPSDNTNGFRQDGDLVWIASDLSGWAQDTVNAVSGKYWIRITRTQVSLATPPVEDLVQVATNVEYKWDSSGALNIASVTSGFGNDVADAGFIRCQNNEVCVAAEADPAGTDGTMKFNTSEEWEFSHTIKAPSFTGTGSTPYIQWPNWTSPTVSDASTGRVVYESATQRLRASLNTAAFSDIALASDDLSLFSPTTIAQLATLLSDENFTPGSETSAEGVLDVEDLQTALTAARCVRINAGGTALEAAAADCNTGGSSHEILSATHTDTTAATVLRGGLMVGQLATPKWQLLTIGGANSIFSSDGTDATWEAATGTSSPVRANNPLFPVQVRFTAMSAPSYAAGNLFYDSTEQAMSFHNDEADITLQIGQEGWIRVRNETGVTITDGQVVYIDGIVSGLPSIALAKADAMSTAQAVGFATHNIEDLSNGFVTLYGVVRDIATTGLTDDIYLSSSTAGAMVDSPPSDPNFVVPLGTVIETGASGKLFVSIVAPRPTGGAGIAVSGNSVAADLLGSQDGTGVAFSFSGLEFGGASSDMLALLQGCADEDIIKWDDESGGNGRWDCAADVSGGSPSLNTVTAAVGTATINSGDNAIVWNWSITTAGKIGFKIGENIASTASTDPILFNIATLTASTAHPFQVTSRGTADGVRVGATDGVMIALGSGGLDYAALLNYPTACSNQFIRALLDTPTCEAVSLTADVSGILPGASGGTNNEFMAFSGPTTSLKTFTLPDATTTILTTNTAVTIGQGGTGQTTANPAFNALSPVTTEGDLIYRNATVNARLARGANGECLTSSTTTILWSSCGTVTLDTIGAAAGPATIANGDNAIVWNWFLTTASKSAFTFGETTASTATGTPILLNIQTLAASTANPLQVTARGTANGIRVGATDGVLDAIGTGGVDFAALLNYPTGCTDQFIRAILDTPTCNTVGTSDLAAGAADNTIIRDSAGFSVIGKSTTGSGDPADIVAGDETVFGRTAAGNLVFAALATGQIANDAITDIKLRNSAGFSVIGKTATGAGDPADIVAGDETVLGRTAAGNLVFAQVATGQVANVAITYAKIQDLSASDRLLGRDTAGAGSAEELTVSLGLSFTGSGGIRCDAASTTAVGCPEMAVNTEVDTGTSTTLAVTPDALAGSTLGQVEVEMTLFDFTTAVTTGDGKYFFHIAESSKLIGMDLIGLTAAVVTVSSSGLPTVDVARCAPVATGNPCSGTVVDVLTTDLTIDVNEDSSFTATAAFSINTANDDVVEDGMWRIDVDIAGTGTQGLIVTLIFQKP